MYISFVLLCMYVLESGVSISDALVDRVKLYTTPWQVDFSQDPDERVASLGKAAVVVPRSHFVFGLWAADPATYGISQL